jgi:hypothetical protein
MIRFLFRKSQSTMPSSLGSCGKSSIQLANELMIDLVLDSRLTPDQREHLDTAQRCAHSLLTLLISLRVYEAPKSGMKGCPGRARLLIGRRRLNYPWIRHFHGKSIAGYRLVERLAACVASIARWR